MVLATFWCGDYDRNSSSVINGTFNNDNYFYIITAEFEPFRLKGYHITNSDNPLIVHDIPL